MAEEIQNPGKGRRDAREKKSSIDIDMNPMVDLAFLLLTFFMLTTTFTQPQVMELVMPLKPKKEKQIEEQAIKESKAITFILSENDKILYYRGITEPELKETDYSPDGIRSLLLRLNDQLDGMVVLIKPSERSSYQNLVDILDEMAITNVSRYAIADYESFDRELAKKYLASSE